MKHVGIRYFESLSNNSGHTFAIGLWGQPLFLKLRPAEPETTLAGQQKDENSYTIKLTSSLKVS